MTDELEKLSEKFVEDLKKLDEVPGFFEFGFWLMKNHPALVHHLEI
jgi:hypothetical protein